MPETFEEQLKLVHELAEGDREWVMLKDTEALKAVLQALKQSNAMCKDLVLQLKMANDRWKGG